MGFLFRFRFGKGENYIYGFRGLRGITDKEFLNIIKNGLEPREPLKNGKKNSNFSRFIIALAHYFGIKVGFGFQTATKNKFNAIWWATKSRHFLKKIKKERKNGIFIKKRFNVIFKIKVSEKKIYGIEFWYPNNGKEKKILNHPVPFLGNFTIFGKIEPKEITGYEIL